MTWNSDDAYQILLSRKDCQYIKPSNRGIEHLDAVYGFAVNGGISDRNFVISRRRGAGAVTVYVNARSNSDQAFPFVEGSGIEITKRYPPGHKGTKGNPGMSAAAARLLKSKANEVLRLEIDSPSALNVVTDWYSGRVNIAAIESPLISYPSNDQEKAAAAPSNDKNIPLKELIVPSEPGEGNSIDDPDISSNSYMADPEKRRIVERVAVERAKRFYQGCGFRVEEKGKPYDLLCTRDDIEVHVEVKGTTGYGKAVVLTIN